MELRFKKENVQDVFPMSDISLGMVFHSLSGWGNAVYHDQMVYQVMVEGFSHQIFNRAFDLLSEKHENLRSNFDLNNFDQPVQIVFKKVKSNTKHEDISNKNKNEQEKYILNFLENDRNSPFELSCDQPLWRVQTFLLAQNILCIIWINHHSIVDGWSTSIIMTELLDIYNKLENDPDYEPVKLMSSYKDFVIIEKTANEGIQAKEFWKNELAGSEGFDFSGIFNKEDILVNTSHKFNEDLYFEIKDVSKKFSISIKSVCFAAYVYALYMISSKHELLVGLINNNRPVIQDSDKIVGCFLNTVPVKVAIKSNITWKEFFNYIDKKLMELKKFENVSYREIVKTYERNNGEELNLNTFFNYTDFYLYKSLGKTDSNQTSSGTLKISSYEKTNTLLDFLIDITGENLKLNIRHYESLISKSLVSDLGRYFEAVINNWLKNPNHLCSKMSCMSDFERKQFDEKINGEYKFIEKNKTILDFFKDSAAKAPDQIAVKYRDKSLSYHNFDIRSSQLAEFLKEKGIKEGELIGISIPRSLDLMIGLFAILKLGCSYLPINIEYPEERKEFMLLDSNTEYLLTNENIEVHHNNHCEVINIVNEYIYNNYKVQKRFLTFIKPSNPAYVIYTSGSTGKPKGVIINHKSLLNRLVWMQEAYPLSTKSIILQKTSISFDVSVWELFWWSMFGASLNLLEDKAEGNPEIIVKTINRDLITNLHFVPSMFDVFLQYSKSKRKTNELKSLEYIFSSGEALKQETVVSFNELLSINRTNLINLYGPTEATIDVTYYNCSELINIANVPIGKPIYNTQIYILNKNLDIQPDSIKGELYIAGNGLSIGYLNNPDLTSNRFIKNPYKENDFLYKTGDIAKWKSDSNIEYIGREDNQIKIRGFRVELGEIETCIRGVKSVDDVVVLFESENKVNPHIVAFVKSENGIEILDIKNYLVNKLPHYMIPSMFFIVDDFKYHTNGKVDRKALINESNKIGKKSVCIEPQSNYEKKVAQLWKEVLNIDKVGLYENFFQIGGDSISILKLYDKFCNSFPKQMEIVDLFRYSTVKDQALYLGDNLDNENKEVLDNESLDMFKHASNNLFEYE
ncbi:MAG: hypothetical protein A2X00_10605 [Bacteroidetes bacterium GWE2_32_14]|nr:MAG: hypothetical protein A2X00_10605 [Bacteroidetes bacterium GWE2_32_14]